MTLDEPTPVLDEPLDEDTVDTIIDDSTHEIGQFICQKIASYFIKSPMRTSQLSGQSYVHEVLNGNPQWSYEVLRMPKDVFDNLCHWFTVHQLLKPSSKGVGVQEQVMMFIAFVGHGYSNRQVQERYQHSGETVSRYFNSVLAACLQLYRSFVCLPPPNITSSYILGNPKFYPYFQNCIGAIDGSHINAFIKEQEAVRFRNRKGTLTQNVLAACTFELQFCYILAGWEGAAHDARVLSDAIRRGFTPPEGFYYLADAGYACAKGFLTPYRGVRYHLKEQAQANLRPQNSAELFNLRHAMLRNVIERIFGIFKRRFKVMATGSEYPFCTQVNLVMGCAAIHNFIRINTNNSDVEIANLENLISNGLQPEQVLEKRISEAEFDDSGMKALRDEIAEAMWKDYINYRR